MKVTVTPRMEKATRAVFALFIKVRMVYFFFTLMGDLSSFPILTFIRYQLFVIRLSLREIAVVAIKKC